MKVTIDELLSLNNSKVIIVDVRDKESFLKGHIPGAVNIYSAELLNNFSNYLDYDKTYYLYCDVGYISSDLAFKLAVFGYKVFSVIGGYKSYLCKR